MANINRALITAQALCQGLGYALFHPHTLWVGMLLPTIDESQTDKVTCPGSRLSYPHSCMTQNPCSSLLRLALVLCFHWQTEKRVDHLEVLCLGSESLRDSYSSCESSTGQAQLTQSHGTGPARKVC